ncbi:MAG: hypothetical protein H5T63_09585, partial [Chloroflexi bacterium]|nr:hypothetical protein [Chloroflexota bacterium]
MVSKMATHLDEGADYLGMIWQNERWAGLLFKWALLVVGLFGTNFWEKYRIFAWLTVGVLGYVLLNLFFTHQLLFRPDAAKSWGRNFYFLSYAADIAFASI